MAFLDSKNLFSNNQALSGVSTESSVFKVGKDTIINPLSINIRLTTGATAGKVEAIKVQSSADSDFTTPVEEMSVTIPNSIDQTKPCVLASFKAPISYQNEYARVIYVGNSALAGAKAFAGLDTMVSTLGR